MPLPRLLSWLSGLPERKRRPPQSRAKLVVESLEERAQPATTLIPGFVQTTMVAGLHTPTSMEFAPDGRLFVAEKGGQVRVVDHGTLLPAPFVTVPVNTKFERGLDGLTLDPHFAQNGYIYVYYTRQQGRQVFNRLSRFTVDPASPNAALPGSETVLLDRIPSPTGRHNGGSLHFGPDGKLYVGIGDGNLGGAAAQSLDSPLGKVLRLNPRVGTRNFRNAIFAMGFRNPFTSGFDPVNGRFYVNDVGEETFEEVDVLRRGQNYGWPKCEGACGQTGLTDPLYQYHHFLANGGEADAITGGVFYRGSRLPSFFQGGYFFADFDKGYIWVLPPSKHPQATVVTTTAVGAVDLDVGPDGSLYYLSVLNGAVYVLTQ
jgi:glucose/arabinose dehydrogenase